MGFVIVGMGGGKKANPSLEKNLHRDIVGPLARGVKCFILALGMKEH
jgi:hypothetical protein